MNHSADISSTINNLLNVNTLNEMLRTLMLLKICLKGLCHTNFDLYFLMIRTHHKQAEDFFVAEIIDF